MEIKDILIIDDEEVILDAVKKIGKMEGFSVDTALTPFLALNMLDKQGYKLILCDIMMPEMDGFQLMDELYNRKLNIPVIMITGYSTVENAVKSLYKGAIDFIPKPFTFDELMSSVYRGFKYLELQKQIDGTQYNSNRDSIIYVPCPPKYMKLGFTSWVLLEQEGVAVVGATDLFLRTVDTITNIELMKKDDVFYQGNSCVQIKSSDGLVHKFMAPVGGKIIERNEKLIENVSLLEKDPYFDGWIYRLIPADIEYDMKYLITCSSDRI